MSLPRDSEREESVLRELRMYYREIIMMVMAERRYKDFHSNVRKEDVSDYYDIVKTPMSLSTMLLKLGDPNTQYVTIADFMEDVELIVSPLA